MYTIIAINLLTACSTLGLPNDIDGAFVRARARAFVCVCARARVCVVLWWPSR